MSMNEAVSKASENDETALENIDPVTTVSIPTPEVSLAVDARHKTHDVQDQESCRRTENTCSAILATWWDARYKWQRQVIKIMENNIFHSVIIALVLIDCLLVISELILDFIQLQKLCDVTSVNGTAKHDEHELHRIELAIEILHFTSVALLSFFLLEVFVKILAHGRHWWNHHDKKMEWLDAAIVIASFVIDIVTIFKKSFFAEASLLLIILRLWRVIRIINSVAQSIRAKDEHKKKSLAGSYHEVVETLLTILEKKTAIMSAMCTESRSHQYDKLCTRFKTIDESCRVIFEECPHPSSCDAVMDMASHLKYAIDRLRDASLVLGHSSDVNHDQ